LDWNQYFCQNSMVVLMKRQASTKVDDLW
jgi:hypothetical protein